MPFTEQRRDYDAMKKLINNFTLRHVAHLPEVAERRSKIHSLEPGPQFFQDLSITDEHGNYDSERFSRLFAIYTEKKIRGGLLT